MIPFTFSMWLFARHVDCAQMYQPSHFLKTEIELYSAEHIDLASCSRCQETSFHQTPASHLKEVAGNASEVAAYLWPTICVIITGSPKHVESPGPMTLVC